jgi:XTP/dITP diphosphohydrolase
LPAGEAFGIEDVAADLVDKLVRRHPHVFAGAEAGSAAELNETWERHKAAEKGRTSAVEGVPMNQPALALAAKLVARARRADLDVPLPAADEFGARLLALAAEAVAAGVDPETALRRSARAYRDAIVSREAEQRADGDVKSPSR